MRYFCFILCVVLVCAQKKDKLDKLNKPDKATSTDPPSGGGGGGAGKIQCGKNEVQNDCPKYGSSDPDCESLLSGFKKNCPPAPADYKCAPRCDCKKDFVRIGNECVSPDRCCTGKNEEITDCPADCDIMCGNDKPLPGCKLTPCFNKGCKCKKNFFRFNCTCIESKDCPEKIEIPQIVKKLEACNAKNKQATEKALKKAGKAKIVTSKNFTKRSNVTAPANVTLPPIDLPKFPINITLPLKLWTRETGLPGKTLPAAPTKDQNPASPAAPQSAPPKPAPSQPTPPISGPPKSNSLKPIKA